MTDIAAALFYQQLKDMNLAETDPRLIRRCAAAALHAEAIYKQTEEEANYTTDEAGTEYVWSDEDGGHLRGRNPEDRRRFLLYVSQGKA